MLNKTIVSACDVKSFSLRLRTGLLKYGINIEHGKVLEVVSSAFQCKSWNVLSSKLKNISKQLPDQKTMILHIDSSANREELDSMLSSAVTSSGFGVMPSSVVDEFSGVSYVFDFKKRTSNNFITFIIVLSNSLKDSKISVKNMFFKRIVVETESFNDFFSSELSEYHEREIKAAFDKLNKGESVFTDHDCAKKIMDKKKTILRNKAAQCNNK